MLHKTQMSPMPDFKKLLLCQDANSAFMEFEEPDSGWSLIYKGLISPFQNKFNTFVQSELK